MELKINLQQSGSPLKLVKLGITTLEETSQNMSPSKEGTGLLTFDPLKKTEKL